MEEGKGKGSSSSSSSSFTSELFGSKESPSAGIIRSLFPPQSKVPGGQSPNPDMVVKSQDSPNEPWNTKNGTSGVYDSGNPSKGHGGEFQSVPNKEGSWIYQEEQRMQPCHLSSSIFYGGREVYSVPQSNQASGLNSAYNDVGEDDSGFATRGNWWKGSLYY